MARIRSLKPTYWADERVVELPILVRYTFLGLISQADDAGRLRGDPRLVKAFIYPLDDEMTSKKVDEHLRRLDRAGRVHIYEVGGTRYLQIVHWNKHQRIDKPSPSEIPPPPDRSRSTPTNVRDSVDDDSANDPRIVDEGSGGDRKGEERDTGKGGGKDTDADGESAVAATTRALSAAANRGLAEHPIRPQSIPRIIATSGSTMRGAEEILAAGVPLEFAEGELYALGRSHEADGQVTTLRYFAPAVIRAWQSHGAGRDANGVTVRPHNLRRNSRYNAGEAAYENARIATEDL